MEDLYGDLENYNSINLVNELKTENAELKHKLGECVSSMDTLQKDFDKMSAEFKVLETNYSSLLKIARAEIKRKTDMITNLNIEKDMLVIKQSQMGPRRNWNSSDSGKAAGKGKNKNIQIKVQGQKQKDDFIRKECERPPSETSSTATDKSNKLSIIENNDKTGERNASKVNEVHRKEVFPDRDNYNDHRPQVLSFTGRRLSSHQFTKFSSDEEFELMYTALEPKTTPQESPFRDELERGRKRSRDDHEPSKTYNEAFGSQNQRPSYFETSRDRYNKNRNSRFCESDRNVNRDKLDLSQSHRNKYSPDRYRRGKREFGEDRFFHQRDRYRRLESPPRERYQHRSRERRPYLDRERTDQKPDMQRYLDSYTLKHNIHGEYDEPQNKRSRVDHQPDEERRQSDRQYSKERQPVEIRNRNSCQSPDYLHSEHVPSNEPIREIRSTAVTKLDDPRFASNKYLKRTEGNKGMLCTISSNKIDLQPINKSLWELEKRKPPEALVCQPSQVSDRLLNEIYMDIDKPLSILAMKPDVGNDVTDYQDVEDMGLNDDASENDFQAKKENVKDNLASKYTKQKANGGEKVQKITKHKISKAKKNSTEEPSASSGKNTNKVDTSTHDGKNVETSLPQKLPLSTNDSQNSNIVRTTGTSVLIVNKDIKNDPSLKPSKTKINVPINREFEHKVYSIRHIVEGDLELSDETNDGTQVELEVDDQLNAQRKQKTKKKSQKNTSREKHADLEFNIKRTRSKKDKEKEVKPKNKFSELFGDSSSLITPEDLELATTQAHAKTGESYVLVCENAQDGINIKENLKEIPTLAAAQNEATKEYESEVLNTICTPLEPLTTEEKNKTKSTKDVKTRTHHSKHKKTEHALASNGTVKDLKPLTPSNDADQQPVDSIETPFTPEVKTVGSSERSDQRILNVVKPAKKTKGEDAKKPAVSNKAKSQEEKTLISTDNAKKNITDKNIRTMESKKNIMISDTKENATCRDSSRDIINSNMPKMLDDTLIPNENTSIDNNKFSEEKLIVNGKSKETICGTRLEEIPNLVSKTQDTGLVQTVVISTGIQASDSNLLELNKTEIMHTPLNTLATSTPAKELSAPNTNLEIESSFNDSESRVNENTVSQKETDVPDVRINYYRRRRKVLKK